MQRYHYYNGVRSKFRAGFVSLEIRFTTVGDKFSSCRFSRGFTFKYIYLFLLLFARLKSWHDRIILEILLFALLFAFRCSLLFSSVFILTTLILALRGCSTQRSQ